MILVETSKFRKLRKKIKSDLEKEALKEAVLKIIDNPETGKRLKGEFKELRSFGYTVQGQTRRVIYKKEKETLIFFSFGPREGIYK